MTDDELFEHCIREHGLVIGKDVPADQLMHWLKDAHETVHHGEWLKHSHEAS